MVSDTLRDSRLTAPSDDEQERTVTALLFDECECGAGPDPLLVDASLSSL
jgi:hypothetical protein